MNQEEFLKKRALKVDGTHEVPTGIKKEIIDTYIKGAAEKRRIAEEKGLIQPFKT